MAKYRARLMDAETGGEGQYDFEGPADLMKRTADEIANHFFEKMEGVILRNHADWEVNGAMKNKDRRIVTAIGQMIPQKDDPPLPFLVMISEV